jgi:hypothetical protein
VTSIGKALLALSFFLVGCSSVREETVTASSHDKVLADVNKSNLPDDDKKMLIDASARASMNSYSLDGKTVGSIIQDQKTFESEQEAREKAQKEVQQRIEAENAKKLAELTGAVNVYPETEAFIPADTNNGEYQDNMKIMYRVDNKSKKTISAIKGLIEFKNAFGDKVIGLSYEDQISNVVFKPGLTIDDTTTYTVNQFDQDWKNFRGYKLSELKTDWVPEQILFADGSSLKATSENSN